MLQAAFWLPGAARSDAVARTCWQTAFTARLSSPNSRPGSDATCSTATSAPCSAIHPQRYTARDGGALRAAAADQLIAAPLPVVPPAASNNGAGRPHGDLWSPEDYTLEAGELSTIDRTSDSGEPPPAFRCNGCVRPECQVRLVHSSLLGFHVQIRAARRLKPEPAFRCRQQRGVQQSTGAPGRQPPPATCGKSCLRGSTKWQ